VTYQIGPSQSVKLATQVMDLIGFIKFVFLKPLIFNYRITKINDRNKASEKNDYDRLYKKNNCSRTKQK
jgi:hypothetical protein